MRGKAGAGDAAAGQPLPEAELSARWLRGPSSAPVVAREGSGGLRAVGRGAGREAVQGGEGAPARLRSRASSSSPALYFNLPSTSIHASTGSFIP